MDEFVLFKFRPDVLDRIASSKIGNLRLFMSEYELTKKELALIWSIKNNIKDSKRIAPIYNFGSDDLFEDAKKQYIIDYNRLATSQKAAEKKYEKFIKSLNPASTHTPFIIAKNNIIMTFDDIKISPSKEIPMVRFNSSSFYKTLMQTTGQWIKLYRGYSNYEELKDFFKTEESSSTYGFKIPKIDKGHIYIQPGTNEGRLEIAIEPEDTDRIVSIIERAFHVSNSNWHKEYINGEFSVNDTNFDWNVMAMLLVKKRFYDNTVFIVESGEVLSKKDRFTLKYHKWGPANGFPIFFTLSNVKNDLVIKIAKIHTDSEIETTINIILSILNDYVEDEENIINLYKEGVPKFSTGAKAKKVAQKEFKTKLRLDALQRAEPEIFTGDYNKKCQGPTKQPRIPTAKEAAKLLKDKPEEIIEFPFGSGKYYTCEPFEKVKGTINRFPGLVKNGEQLVPCCYPLSHYAKPNSLLNKYITDNTLGAKKEPAAIDKKQMDHVLGEEKRLPEFRRGRVSERLAYILSFLGLDPEQYNRFGVPASPQSIIDAMALIYDPVAFYRDARGTRKRIVKKLLASSYLSAAAQSYTTSYLRDALERGGPIGAAEFHPVVEYFFKATVLVIQGDDLARPENKFGFMAHLRLRKKLIILYMHQGYDQVEVIGTVKKDFTDYPIEVINSCLDLKRQCYGYYSMIQYRFPRISEISRRASAQYIDSFGKNRGFVIDGQTIFLPPSAPTGKPIMPNDSLFYNETSDIIKLTGEVPLYYKDGIVYTENFMLPTKEDDHKILNEPPKEFIPAFIIATTNFVADSMAVEKKALEKIKDKDRKRFIKRLKIDADTVLTIYPQDEEGYLQLVKTLPVFEWENLVNLKWNPGQIHWVSIKNEQFIVRDVEYKPEMPDSGIGTWSVAIGDKVSDEGQFIEYPDSHWGVILE